MKKYAMLVLTLLLGGLAVARWDTNGWQARRQLADSLLQTLAPHIGEVLPSSQYPTNEVLALAYPELLRYSPARDYVEREVNRRLYAEHGLKDEVDFSTGLFQMKPSFAERVEAYYRLALPNHPCAQDFVYPQTDSVALRSARLTRLADSRWQLVYLRGFYCLVQHRFPLLATYPPAKRVRLMALAYNAGFHLPEAQLWRWEKVKLFPYGGLAEMIGRANTHSYADLAEEFFAQPNH
jgi:hypothetical protein